MKYIVKKRALKMYIFLLTGSGLALLSGYELYNYAQINQFVYEFPGDWDKPIGIAVGLLLIIRSTKFISESRQLFIEVSKDCLAYRTNASDSVRKITLSDIKKVKKNGEKIILISKDATELTIVNFDKLRVREQKKKRITKALIQLNHVLTPVS
jgi:hypothetical protein